MGLQSHIALFLDCFSGWWVRRGVGEAELVEFTEQYSNLYSKVVHQLLLTNISPKDKWSTRVKFKRLCIVLVSC